MDNDFLHSDRLPTLDEMKEMFKKNDWTTLKIDDPDKRTAEEWAEISYVAEIMDKKFEELVRKRGRLSTAEYYSEDNPLIVLQKNTKDKSKNTLTPDPNAELREPPKSVENEAISNILVSQYIETLDEVDRKIFIRKRLGYTQTEIAKELGFSNNGAVSKRLADMERRFLEMIK